jgi:PhnB protein
MSTVNVAPYLFFSGNCREAMESYKGIFGGELSLMTYAEGPEGAPESPHANQPELRDKIMHATLAGEVVLMASDNPDPSQTLGTGKISLALGGSDEATLRGWFDELSKDGTVLTSLEKQFCGDAFGMVTDKFDVTWMVSISTPSS